MNRINFESVIMSHMYIYVYAYDKGGNRETEKIYAFTTSDTLGEVLETKTSEYNYLVWKDRLSSFNGKAVKYDNAGNPTSYDGKTYKWDGRNLKEIALADGSKTQFEYDQDGLRTQKRQYKADGGLNYFVDYIWEDGKLTYQYLTLAVYITNSQGVTTMRELGPITSKIIYDDSGLPQGFMINDGAEYAFVRNLQGDVIAMVDQNGETVMEYSYDPWGKIEYHLNDESLTEEDAALITALCPLTYRGYNYDFTTGLYYLQSRYYNPEWGRFLNCDDTNILLTTQGETHNANLFAYCDNNPINYTDYTGYFKSIDHYNYTVIYARYLFGFHYGSVIAKGSYDVDDLYPPVAKFYSKYNQSFHFNVNKSGPDSRDVRAQELCKYAWDCVDYAKQYKPKGCYNEYRYGIEHALYMFGQALHPLQDKIAHSGKTGDIKIGIGKASFHMHLLNDDNPSGIYYHPILGAYMTKHDAVQINTAFILLVIYTGLIERGIDVEELKREPAHISNVR